MSDSADPRVTWGRGYTLLLIAPFIGLALTLADPPSWLQVVGVVAILALVAAGSTLMRRRAGAWRPSETVAHPRDDGL